MILVSKVALAEASPNVIVYELASTFVIWKLWFKADAAIQPPKPVEVALEKVTKSFVSAPCEASVTVIVWELSVATKLMSPLAVVARTGVMSL